MNRYNRALNHDPDATVIVLKIMDKISQINGVIPDRSLVTVDQRAMKFDQPVTFNIEASTGRLGIDEFAKVLQENNRCVTDASPEGE